MTAIAVERRDSLESQARIVRTDPGVVVTRSSCGARWSSRRLDRRRRHLQLVLFIALQLTDSSTSARPATSLPSRVQQTVNALSIGAIYALIALGYTMVYGIIELINFAHGDVFMVGAFLSVVVTLG